MAGRHSSGDDLQLPFRPAVLGFYATAQGNTTLTRAQFQGAALGKLLVMLDGEIRVSSEQATSLTAN
jgi:hypothetical protein